ncbi:MULTISPECIES: putative T7SS-secreted protein [unclassified Streptomyces]|uniref:putative T7SS-secreted protein n=1 Tax=unclassified Streptomyces TaxID=2593676 RepID=UPI00382053CB
MSTMTYEALGFDPAPGIPASVERLVTTLSKVGNELHQAHSTLTRLGRSDGIWEGDAAAGFAQKVGELPKYLNDGYGSLIDAAHSLHQWQAQLVDFQTLAARYETEAAEARRVLKAAEGDPDLKLAGQTFDTDAALQNAQQRLDFAVKRVNDATGDLSAVIKKAQDLLGEHEKAARTAASAVRKAAERAPDEPGLFDRFMDALKGLGDKIKELAGDVWAWMKEHADTLYKIGDWLGYASAACDVLAVVFSETVIGAVVFEAIGMVLNGGALAFHAAGWAAGSKKGSWTDIGLDIAGFIPFGDLARGGKVLKGAFKGVSIPSNVLQMGSKAADAFKRADDIVASVGGSAWNYAEREGMRSLGIIGGKVDAVKITADTFKERFQIAVAKEFGDSTLYRAASGRLGSALDQVVPKLVEHTPLGRIPAIADSVKPVMDDAGNVVRHYVDPRSWTARGYEAITGAKGLYTEGVRLVTDDVQYASDKVHESIDHARETAGRVLDGISRANPFG